MVNSNIMAELQNNTFRTPKSNTKFYLQDFPLDQSFVGMFKTLKYFLKSENIRIQFEAVRSLTYIFNQKWLSGQPTVDDGVSLTDILCQIYGDVSSNLPEISPEDDFDKKSSKLAVRVQFHCSIVASCFCLRRENWFRLFELCCVIMRIRKGKLFSICIPIEVN